MSKHKNPPRCNFCGRTVNDGVSVIANQFGGGICSECAYEVSNAFNGTSRPKGTDIPQIETLPTPREMVHLLDQHVVGQDEAKRTLAIAVYNHYSRLFGNEAKEPTDDLSDVKIEKSNVLMIGPTGSGKTLLAKTLAKILHVPFAIADATTLTEAGYVGEDVENIVRYLYENADRDVSRTQMGIVMLDEADKIASKTQNVSITRDVSGEGVQQALLKIVEGTICRFPPKGGRKHPDQEYVEIDTSNILFICGGAFVGLDKIVEKRVKENGGCGTIGFSVEEEDHKREHTHLSRVQPEDLVAYGMIPELVGRLPIITEMEELTEDQLVQVLTQPKNSLTKQYQKLLRHNHILLKYEEDALREMAILAKERKTGARGLRAEMESVMRDIMFEAPENRQEEREVIITKAMVEKAA